MAPIRQKGPGRAARGLRSFLHVMKDKWLITSIAILLVGVFLFQLSSISPRQVLESYVTGNATFEPHTGQNRTVYFATPYEQMTLINAKIPPGLVISYTIFWYKNVSDYTIGIGKPYYQSEVMHGTLSHTNDTITLPTSYVDDTYFINATLLSGATQNVTLTAYAQFYQVQRFQYPEEISGVLLSGAGFVMLAARITMLNTKP